MPAYRSPRSLRTALTLLALGSLLSGCSLIGNATPVPSPTPSASPIGTPAYTPAATPTAMPSATPTMGPCEPADLAARITAWEAGAGHRVASVELTYSGASACTISALSQPQLVDGNGAVLIDSAPPSASAVLTLAPGAVVNTLVQDGNYCGPAAVPPVSVAFILPPAGGRIVATPLSSTDTSGVPPCSGPAGSAGDIEMHPWAP